MHQPSEQVRARNSGAAARGAGAVRCRNRREALSDPRHRQDARDAHLRRAWPPRPRAGRRARLRERGSGLGRRRAAPPLDSASGKGAKSIRKKTPAAIGTESGTSSARWMAIASRTSATGTKRAPRNRRDGRDRLYARLYIRTDSPAGANAWIGACRAARTDKTHPTPRRAARCRR